MIRLLPPASGWKWIVQAYKKVEVVGHVVNGQHFMLAVLHHSGDIGAQAVVPLGPQQGCAVFDRKYTMDVELCIGVGHNAFAS